jgi:hypothetical protein
MIILQNNYIYLLKVNKTMRVSFPYNKKQIERLKVRAFSNLYPFCSWFVLHFLFSDKLLLCSLGPCGLEP